MRRSGPELSSRQHRLFAAGEFEALRASGNAEMPASAPPSGTYQLLVIVRHSGSRLTAHTQEILVP